MNDTKQEQSGLRVTGIVGTPGPFGKSRNLVERALALFADMGVETSLVVIGDIPADALLFRAKAPEMEAALIAVERAHIVVVGSPVYKATYTGALKCFFDNLPQRSLAGKVAVPMANGGSPNHMLALDHGLRPLLASEGAVTTARGIYAVDTDFTEGQPNEAVAARLLIAVSEAVTLARALRAAATDPDE